MPRKINPNSLKNLEKRKPFVKGDERINYSGRAASFDELRALFQEIANEEINDSKSKSKKTRLRKIGETLAGSQKSMKDFLEFGYGKVPLSQIVDITSGGKAITWKMFINGDSDDTNSQDDNK